MCIMILPVCCLSHGPSSSNYSLPRHPSKPHLSATSMPIIPTKKLKQQQQLPLKADILEHIKAAYMKLVDGFVDSMFEFYDQTLGPTQSNFAPVEEMGEAVAVTSIQGTVPEQFPEGIYIRNGPNPAFGGLKSTRSIFGRSSYIWVEGEGMLHALYFSKDDTKLGKWNLLFNNRYVQTQTFRLEKLVKNRPSFLLG